MIMINKIKKIATKLIFNIPRHEKTTLKPLKLEDFSGYNQPFHPSILYFQNGLFGYKYWMVQTPYPVNGVPYRDRWKCPCIYYSNDGLNWKTGNSINPLDNLYSEEISNHDYFSDPHLVYRNDTKELECWYRITHMDKSQRDRKMQYPTYLLRKTTKNGFQWSERELLMDFQCNNSLDDMVRSPSVIWDQDRKVYHAAFVVFQQYLFPTLQFSLHPSYVHQIS